jgi:hypothetical protein
MISGEDQVASEILNESSLSEIKLKIPHTTNLVQKVTSFQKKNHTLSQAKVPLLPSKRSDRSPMIMYNSRSRSNLIDSAIPELEGGFHT